MSQATETSSNEQMIQSQLIERGITDTRVLDAMRQIPRERFFPEDRRDDVFADRASSIGHGQTISQPYIVALMTEKLNLTGSERVLEIGTGSGYQTAILSRLAREVFSVERIKPLLDVAFERLLDLGCRNVHFKLGDGSLGWPAASGSANATAENIGDRFDRILIAAATPTIPESLLLAQLLDGGSAVIPVGSQQEQTLLLIERHGKQLKKTTLSTCRFVPLLGEAGWPETAAKAK